MHCICIPTITPGIEQCHKENKIWIRTIPNTKYIKNIIWSKLLSYFSLINGLSIINRNWKLHLISKRSILNNHNTSLNICRYNYKFLMLFSLKKTLAKSGNNFITLLKSQNITLPTIFIIIPHFYNKSNLIIWIGVRIWTRLWGRFRVKLSINLDLPNLTKNTTVIVEWNIGKTWCSPTLTPRIFNNPMSVIITN